MGTRLNHLGVPTMYVLSENIRKIQIFPVKFSIFTSFEKKTQQQQKQKKINKPLFIAWASFRNDLSQNYDYR